jgi:hypothetical protein
MPMIEKELADTLVELGSGTSDKTRALLDAFAAAGSLRPLSRRRRNTARRRSSLTIPSARRSSITACCERLRCSLRAAAATRRRMDNADIGSGDPDDDARWLLERGRHGRREPPIMRRN